VSNPLNIAGDLFVPAKECVELCAVDKSFGGDDVGFGFTFIPRVVKSSLSLHTLRGSENKLELVFSKDSPVTGIQCSEMKWEHWTGVVQSGLGGYRATLSQTLLSRRACRIMLLMRSSMVGS
jgi:hypothetical protein